MLGGETEENEPEYPSFEFVDVATSVPDGIERMDPMQYLWKLREAIVDFLYLAERPGHSS